MNLVRFACPNCRAPETLTYITVAGDPFCLCNLAVIHSEAAVGYVRLGMAEYAQEKAARSAHFAFEARPDFRVLVTAGGEA